MAMNIIFLAGGICVGYLIRGEVQRRKSNKAIADGLELCASFLKGLADSSSEKSEETENIETESYKPDMKVVSNSSDEIIDLKDILKEAVEDK